MIYNLMVLSTQRENIYININGVTDINYYDLWIRASEKRYVKFNGFLLSIQEKTIEDLKKHKNTRYFNSIKDFLKW